LLYREQHTARKLNAQHPAILPLRLFVRMTLYTFLSTGSLIIVILLEIPGVFPTHLSRIPALYILSLTPLFGALLFGSQVDIICWYLPGFWKGDHPTANVTP